MKIVSAEKKVDKLVEKYTEIVEEKKVAKITLAENENKYKCSSCTLYIVLMIVVFSVCAGIGTYFVYNNWFWLKYFCALNLILVLRQQFSKLINGRSQKN